MTDRPNVALRQVGARGTVPSASSPDGLENAITAELSDGAEAFVVATRSVYRWKPGDQASPLLGEAIVEAPLAAGRWNEQVGLGPDRVITTELAADVVVGAGLTVELLSITVQAVGRRFVTAIGALSATWTAAGDLELQLFVSVDGGAFTEVNAGAVQTGANGERRGITVAATLGPYAVATSTVAYSLRLLNGLASSVTVSPAGGNACSLRIHTRRASVSNVEPGLLYCGAAFFGANNITPMVAYLPSQLATTVASMPTLVLVLPTATNRAIRFRVQPVTGKIWLLGQGNGTNAGSYLTRFSRSEIGQRADPTPEVAVDVTPVRTGPNYPTDFDFILSTGRCFVVTQGFVKGFDTAQIAVTGQPVPAITLSVAGASLQQGILVQGDELWVADYTAGRAVKFSAAQLNGAGGVVVPPVILSGANFAGGVEYMAFDAAGNMWITFYDVNQARCYAAADLLVSGNPVPLVILTFTTEAAGASGIAFDDDGNLFISNFENGRTYKFLASQITTSGVKVPVLTLTSNSLQGASSTLTFDRGTP